MPTPTCPKCRKVFTKDSSITRHLSQPWTSCHSSIHDIVDILEFTDVVPPQRSLDPPQNLDTSVDMSQGFGVGGKSGRSPTSSCVLPLAWQQSIPFYSPLWYVSSLLLSCFDHDITSQIKQLQLSFNNAKDFWKCQLIPSLHGMKSPIQLFWRDPVNNPLVHDQLDFIPHHLLHVYLECIQDQLPQGATILGTVLSSDKTNVTTMTGARVTHLLLLGLANIHMHTPMKLLSKTFMLTALLPILQYLHPNQQMQGMLEDCLIHEYLLIVLQPLMKAAELGIMMSDPACMLACVHGKTSPFTLALYLQFGDNFCHPAYFWLNGVFAPFWKGWWFSDPAIFLTLEALHHWHKQFYDHDMQCCLVVLGVVEFDFQMSILQPITGYHHFSNRISKLKQVMGRVHHDIQHYIIGLIAVQSPSPDDSVLTSINRSLAIFHNNKDAMGTKRVIDNWHIPKLELMQSITASISQVSALIQWSTDATEHAHISEIKDPVWHMNNNDYDPQICYHLDQAEKLHHFAIATTLKSLPTDPDLKELHEVEWDEDEEENGAKELNHTRTSSNYFSKIRMLATARHNEIPQAHSPCTFLAGSTAIHLNCNPTCTGLKIDEVADQFNILDLWYALSGFLQCNARKGDGVFGVGVPRRLLIDHPLNIPFEHIQIWHTVRLQQVCLHNPSVVLPVQTMHASPARDVAILSIDSAYDWLKSGLKAFVNIIPRLGTAADPQLTKSTSVHYHSSFYLNKYFDKQIYDTLYYAL
ncbi:uncharacterized protein BJ212DRAFT_1445288 [Suillus subaureus]|uniref:DUF6830 domain-containing protein n=1 Tax=Suillus subaureus TaxID=48587 RepID=A0A9P7JGV7_9AGAM|nr:uncharacterized protein BJ212DRAFT_1445288 [Suillus subaureus]KAG1821858.1 hypothetical protein BJ212DRAFT_1445288 [Suillus subaureus]